MKETFMQKFKRVFHSGRNMKLLEYTIKHDALIDKALHTTEPGVSDEKLCGGGGDLHYLCRGISPLRRDEGGKDFIFFEGGKRKII